MSKQNISIKANNHRIHPCPTERKLALISEIVSRNSTKDIVIVSSDANDMIKENISAENVSVLTDKELITNKDLTCELLISYDLPDTAIIYIARVAKATKMALILLDTDEQKQLYKIELLLGRTIKYEVINGYEPQVIEKKQDPNAPKKMSKEKIKEVAKKRYDEKTKDKVKKEFKKQNNKSETPDKWKKKKKAPNKFLGKDENGKAIFSGKSGDRNHRYDGTPKDKYNAPKKIGKKIKIKIDK